MNFDFDFMLKVLGMIVTGIPFVLGTAFVLVRWVTNPIDARLTGHINEDHILFETIKQNISRVEGKLDIIIGHLLTRQK